MKTTTRRAAPLALLLSLLLFSAAWALIPLPAQAANLPQSGPVGKLIDWAHPFPAHLPAPGQPRSGIGSPSSGTARPSPDANFPGGCYRGSAYNVIVQGQTVWTAISGSVEARVEYQWCPRWNGDQQGINWAYGRAYVTGCATVYLGNLSSMFSNPVGPLLVYPLGAVWDDDEYAVSYFICNGSAWDYSLTARGDGLYKVWMFAQSDGGVLAVAQSPCFC